MSEEKKTEPEIIETTPVKREGGESSKRSGGWLSWWRRPKHNEEQIRNLQSGFHELVNLTRSIREHMDQQAQTQKAVVGLMQQLPAAVDGLKSVGKATEQQTETLGLLKKQLESSGRNEEKIVESFRNFNRTLELMDEMSKNTSQTVATMSDRTRDSEDMLRSILERSEKRLVYLIVTLMAATVLVLGVGLYIGFSSRPATVVEPVIIETLAPQAEEVTEPYVHRKSIVDLGEEAEPAPAPEAEPAAETGIVVDEEAVEDPATLDADADIDADTDPDTELDPMATDEVDVEGLEPVELEADEAPQADADMHTVNQFEEEADEAGEATDEVE